MGNDFGDGGIKISVVHLSTKHFCLFVCCFSLKHSKFFFFLFHIFWYACFDSYTNSTIFSDFPRFVCLNETKTACSLHPVQLAYWHYLFSLPPTSLYNIYQHKGINLISPMSKTVKTPSQTLWPLKGEPKCPPLIVSNCGCVTSHDPVLENAAVAGDQK